MNTTTNLISIVFLIVGALLALSYCMPEPDAQPDAQNYDIGGIQGQRYGRGRYGLSNAYARRGLGLNQRLGRGLFSPSFYSPYSYSYIPYYSSYYPYYGYTGYGGFGQQGLYNRYGLNNRYGYGGYGQQGMGGMGGMNGQMGGGMGNGQMGGRYGENSENSQDQ